MGRTRPTLPADSTNRSFYLASCFDLIALQEVNEDLDDFERLIDILGRNWDYLLTDTTEGSRGNGERMAFLFNRDKVWFRKVTGEIVLPKWQLVVPAAWGCPCTSRRGAEIGPSPFPVSRSRRGPCCPTRSHCRTPGSAKSPWCLCWRSRGQVPSARGEG